MLFRSEEMASNSIISLSNLSTVLLERYDVFGRPDDLEEARKGCEKACREGLKLKPNVVRGTHVHGEIMMVIWATGLKLLRPMTMPYGAREPLSSSIAPGRERGLLK